MKLKRLLSALMCMALVFTLLPAKAQAADAPTFNAEITNTHKITLTFNKNMMDPDGLGGGGFSYTINGNAQTVTSITYNAGSPLVYILELHVGIQPGDTVALTYTPGTIQSADGGILESVSGMALTNNVSNVAPTIFVVTTQDDNNNINNDGTYLSVSFSLPMADPPTSPGGFTVSVDGNDVSVTHIYRKTSFNNVYILRLGTAIEYGQTVSISYTPGSAQSAYGVALAAASNHYVNNQLPQPSSADLTNIALSGSPSNFTFSAGTYTYNNVTVANSVTGITVTPTGAGTITVDETQVASGNASAEIALTAGVERTILINTTETDKATKTYTVKVTRLGSQATPTFTPAEGAVAFGSELQIISANAEHIYYTTDGSIPGTSAGGATLEYNDSARPIINQAMTIRAVAVKAGWGNSECATAVYTQAVSASLTNIALSGNPSNFTFSSGTYTYNNVTVANNVTGITVTPTGAGTITVDGTVVASGNASGEILLTAGTEKTITVIATEIGKSPITYLIKVTRAQISSGTPTPTYNAEVSGGGALKVTVNQASGRATVTAGGLGGSMQNGGNETITMPSINGITSFTLGIPLAYLSTPGGGTLTFRTDTGNMILPADMLSGIKDADSKNAEITIAAGDKTGLSEEAKAAIGDRPLIELSLTFDGEQTDWSNPDAPVTVSIPYTPTEDELQNPEAIVIWYLDGDGNPICVPSGRYDAASGTVTFTTTHFSVYAVAYNDVRFSDVSGWYKDYVDFVSARDIMTGTDLDSFSPDGTMTRAMLVTVLYRMSSDTSSYTNNFSDVLGEWYENAVAWASANGITGGVGNGKFAPELNITREQLAVMLYRYAEYMGRDVSVGEDTNILSYNDVLDISEYAYSALQWACGAGILEGEETNNLNPQCFATRAEAAAILQRFIENVTG